jgi:hypothetical protein
MAQSRVDVLTTGLAIRCVGFCSQSEGRCVMGDWQAKVREYGHFRVLLGQAN